MVAVIGDSAIPLGMSMSTTEVVLYGTVRSVRPYMYSTNQEMTDEMVTFQKSGHYCTEYDESYGCVPYCTSVRTCSQCTGTY